MCDPTRRRYLRHIGAATAVALAGCRGGDGTPSSEATTESRATATATLKPTPEPAAGPTRWRVDFEGGQPTEPAVGALVAVGIDTEVRAYEPSTGERTWSRSFEHPVGSLDTDGTTLYAAVRERNGAFPRATTVVALDFATGTRRWAVDFDGGVSVSATGGGRVFLTTFDDLGNNTETIHVLDATDGADRWTRTFPEPQNLLVDEDTLHVASTDGIRALDAASGDVRWYHHLDYQFATLVVGPETVAAVENVDIRERALHVLDRRGELRWTFDEWLVVGLTLHDGQVYAGGEHLAAFDPAEPEPRWLVERGGFLYHAPVVDDAILSGSDGIRAYELDTGGERWAFSPEETSPLPSGVRAGTVYGRTPADEDNLDVFGVDADDGTERWHLTAEDRLSDVIIGRQGAYVTSDAGVLYALA